MTVATLAKVLQWPFTSVWPLLFFRKKRAKELARSLDVSLVGKLRIKKVDQRPNWLTGHNVGYVSLLIGSQWVRIRPCHFGGYNASVFDFSQLRLIEFEYHPGGVRGIVETHPYDPSSYLTIKNVG